jgi:hypothetical protein
VSLLGSKCVRCAKRTRHVYQDQPTCEPCAHEIELAFQAAKEAPRSCPSDGSVLAKMIVHGTVIDRCPKCLGVWLDAGELERMTSEAVFAAIVARGGALPPPI